MTIIKRCFISLGRNKNRNSKTCALGRNLGHPSILMDKYSSHPGLSPYKSYWASLWCCDNVFNPSSVGRLLPKRRQNMWRANFISLLGSQEDVSSTRLKSGPCKSIP